MRIALTLHAYPPDELGGTEATVSALAAALQREGHGVFVIAGGDRWREGAGVKLREHLGIPVYRVQRDDPHYGHWHKLDNQPAGEAFEAILARERPDVVHVHHWLRLSGDLVRRSARVGIPAVLTLHDYSSTCLISHRIPGQDSGFCQSMPGPDPCIACAAEFQLATPWVSKADEEGIFSEALRAKKSELNSARSIVCLSKSQALTVERMLGLAETPKVIPPISSSESVQGGGLRKVHDGVLRLGAWGSVHPLKGSGLLVEAVGHAVSKGARIELHFAGHVGDPDYLTVLENKAAGLPVLFHGPYGDLSGHPVSRVCAFISGTLARETWGVVVDEALRLGLPSILPQSGAFQERFGLGQCVVFYPRGNPEALGELLRALSADPTPLLRASSHVEAACAQLPTMGETANSYLALYRHAIEQGSPDVDPSLTYDIDAAAKRQIAWDAGFVRTYRSND